MQSRQNHLKPHNGITKYSTRPGAAKWNPKPTLGRQIGCRQIWIGFTLVKKRAGCREVGNTEKNVRTQNPSLRSWVSGQSVLEFSLRFLPSHLLWGTLWVRTNFTPSLSDRSYNLMKITPRLFLSIFTTDMRNSNSVLAGCAACLLNGQTRNCQL